jgi:hypothetical protein
MTPAAPRPGRLNRHRDLPAMLWTWIGLSLIALAAARLLLSLVTGIRRARAEAQQHALDLERLQTELATARELRRRAAEEPLPWNGFRKFVVYRKVAETPAVCSFHLQPHDGKTLPSFKPGQYLTFRLPNKLGNTQLIRCYSLSDRAHSGHYRVTIKRASPPPGVPAGAVSSLFHDVIQEGDILDVRAPTGHFWLEPTESDPVVLIGSGIGVTPVFSMLAALQHERSRRTVWFFYGVRHRRDVLFAEELATMVRENPQLTMRICLSQPEPGDRLGTDYQVHGRVTTDLLKQELPSSNFRFYYCGPSAMMEELTSGLKQWGVPASHLHFEAFGPSSVKRVNLVPGSAAPVAAASCLVTFRKSARSLAWDGVHDTLLDLAEHAGIMLPSGCRAGNCGTCSVALQSGEVSYIQTPGSPPEARTCLTCIARPKGDIVLEA